MSKVDYIFVYEGITGDQETGEFVGYITDCELRDEKTPDYMHNIPTHRLTGFSKKDLWDNVLRFVSDNCVIEVVGEERSLIKIGE